MALPYVGPDDPSDIKGSGLPTQQPDEARFVKGQGWTTIQPWEGPKKDGIVGKAQEMVLAGFTNIHWFKAREGVWRVEGSVEGQGDGSEPEPAETWELDNLSESADIATHPYFQSVSDDELRKVLEAIKNPVAGTAPALTQAGAIDLYTLLLRKYDTYAYSSALLRLTEVPARSDIPTNGLEAIWTPQQIGVGLQSIATAVVNLLANNPFGIATDFTWGWKLDTIRVTEDTNGKSRMQMEWILGLWPNVINGAY